MQRFSKTTYLKYQTTLGVKEYPLNLPDVVWNRDLHRQNLVCKCFILDRANANPVHNCLGPGMADDDVFTREYLVFLEKKAGVQQTGDICV